MMTYSQAIPDLDDKRLSNSITSMVMILALVLLFFVGVLESTPKEVVGQASIRRMVFSEKNSSVSVIARKLLQSTDDVGEGEGDGNRIGTACSKDDIVILQGSMAPLPNGIPSYSVEIVNVCVSSSLSSGCSISNIHVSCGWFSSVRLINPNVFRRLYYDDCLVNDGQPLSPGQCLSFQYANTFSYPLSVSSFAC